MKLYEIVNALENLEFIDMETGEVNQELLDTLNIELDIKLDNMACWIKNLNAEVDAIKVEEKALADRRKAKEKKAESLKQYISDCMKMAGKKKFETPRAVLSFRNSKAVNIIDQNMVPEQFIQVIESIKIDKKAIGDAIKAGEVVLGAELVENMNLQIK